MTDVALKEYFDRRLDDFARRVDERNVAAERALEKAERLLSEYKASSNEWRGALRDQASLMATRAELGALDTQVQELRRGKANLDGRLAVTSGGISFVVSLLLWALARAFR